MTRLAKQLELEEVMIQQGLYKHYKGGFYTVLMAARCSDNGPNEGENVVVYVSHTTGTVCTRFARSFFEDIIDPKTNKKVIRFEFVVSTVNRVGD